MEATNYTDSRGTKPVPLAVAIVVHGALLGALFLAPPEMLPPLLKPIPSIKPTIPLIPPIRVEKPVEPRAGKQMVDALTPKVPVTHAPSGDLVTFPESEVIPGGGSGTAIDFGNPVKIIELKPDPVLIEASFDPRFAGKLQPPYPPGLQRQEIEGAVVIRVLVAPDGRVKQVEAIRADEEGFLKSTRDWALRHWRFRPATRDGVAIESWRRMTVSFRMNL